MVSLNEGILKVLPSPTLAAAARANELKAAGRDVISFTAGEPDFDTPDHIKQAAIEALKKGKTRYTAVPGIAELKAEIQAKYRREQSVEFKPSEIIVTNGGKQSLAASLAVLLNRGDEVLIHAPYWTSYPEMVHLAGGIPVVIDTKAENGYRLMPDDLERALTDRTKVVILNSPSNPAGACFSRDDFRELYQVIKAHPRANEIIVISDEVYEYITFGGFQQTSFAAAVPEFREQTIISNAFSKAYSMTGWRVGWAAGPEGIIKKVSTHQSHFTSNVCSIAQWAAVAASQDGGAFPRMMCESFAKRLDLVCEAIDEIDGVSLPTKPLGAFYVFIRIDELRGRMAGDKKIENAEIFCDYLLEQYDVAVVSGEAFGDPWAFRVSFATGEEDLRRGMERIAEAVAALS